MSTPFEDMTNAQLKEACEEFGLEVVANNPSKPNKAEYLKAINDFKAEQDLIHGAKEPKTSTVSIEDEDDAPKPTGKFTSPKQKKPQTQAQLVKLDAMKKDRVIVRDMQETQTKDELISVNWGNRLIGRHTDWVDLSGEPQYVRRGALYNLKDATMSVQQPKKGGGVEKVTKKRFVVVDVDPLTPQELSQLASIQSMRNSKQA
jgi:hypothetical protein